MRTYKYKIQNHKRNRHLESDKRIISQVHNHFIALSRRHYRIYGHCEGYKRATYNRMSKHLTKLKKLAKYAHWRVPHSWALQECLKRIESGYINFFEGRAKRPPKFKGWRKYRSMTFNGKQVKIEKLEKDTGCRVAKIRIARRNQRRMRFLAFVGYRFWYSREIQGNIKRVTVKQDALGDWYISITTDFEGFTPEPKTGDAAGFDYGNHKTFLTCSDDTKYQSPEFYKQSANAVRRANRQLSRKQRGSNNRKRASKHYARTHRKIVNQREDHHWKLTLELLRKFDVCFFEDLNLDGNLKRLWGRKVSDLAFGEFMLKMKWQAKKRGKRVETIGRWQTTTPVCHECGQKHLFINLDVRDWYCHSCKIQHDRDVNAAINDLPSNPHALACVM